MFAYCWELYFYLRFNLNVNFNSEMYIHFFGKRVLGTFVCNRRRVRRGERRRAKFFIFGRQSRRRQSEATWWLELGPDETNDLCQRWQISESARARSKAKKEKKTKTKGDYEEKDKRERERLECACLSIAGFFFFFLSTNQSYYFESDKRTFNRGHLKRAPHKKNKSVFLKYFFPKLSLCVHSI